MRKETAKKITKNAGKVGLTTLVPPAGLSSFFKGRQMLIGAGIGAFLSGLSSMTIDEVISKDVLYDNPKIIEYENSVASMNPLFIPVAFLSPLAYTYYAGDYTVFEKEGLKYEVLSKVITFDEQSKRYSVNFTPDMKFRSNHNQGYHSVYKAGQRIDDLKTQIQDATYRGDINKAKDLSNQLERAIAYHEEVSFIYNQVKETFEQAVGNMNAELDSLERRAQ